MTSNSRSKASVWEVCGLSYSGPPDPYPKRFFLPQVAISAHTSILSSVSRTNLKQAFVNPSDSPISELRYVFPLFNGVSVVGFTFTINEDRVVKGVVKEKQQARQDYQEAVDQGQTAGLFEQSPKAGDVFTTSIGNVPAGAKVVVEITYLGELQHDAEAEGIRLTIPTAIAPRYGSYPGELLQRPSNVGAGGIEITVDAEMPEGCNIKSIQSPSHPISVSLGSLSTADSDNEDMSLSKASATLSLGSAELEKDFVLTVVAPNVNKPVAILETHPRYPSQRALMATLVPKFKIPEIRPEIVFICDRSGSMGGGQQIPNLKSALNIFLRSLPVGVKFNICSFGSRFEFLFPEGSQSYDQESMDRAVKYVETFTANFGGTEMQKPIEAAFEKRYKDMDLEVFLLTDGEVWGQEGLFNMVNKQVRDSKGAIRLFTLGIGASVSHSLIQGLARSGNGFSQAVADNEKMSNKVVKMLRASLTPHVTDYSLEVRYADDEFLDISASDDGDDFELVEKTSDSLVIRTLKGSGDKKAHISLFDESAGDTNGSHKSDKGAANKFSHVPPIDPPKILQSPINIPSLFPSSRTTVYLLLSPRTTQNMPKAVIYRGTSRHGPLELEIPVTALSEDGETIHQLAARAAVKEMEEGRGWIYEAKGEDGKPLQETFEGRFPDMVEREAARLGVQYQVANKWCSFVAIEAKTGKEVEQPKAAGAVDEGFAEDFSMVDSSAVPYVSCASVSFNRALPWAQGMPRAAMATQGQECFKVFSPVPPPPPAPAPARAARGMGLHSMAMQSAPLPPPPRAQMNDSVDDGLAALGIPRHRLESGKTCRRKSKPSFATGGASAPSVSATYIPEGSAGAGISLTDPLEKLVSLQTFEGSWSLSQDLLQLLGLEGPDMAKAFSSDSKPICSSEAGATAATVAFLRTKMASREDEWEMLVQKAVGWLDNLGGSLTGEELVAKAVAALFTA